MRYLQIVDCFSGAGGLERFVYNFTQSLESQGAETVVAAFEVDAALTWGASPIKSVCLAEDYKDWERFASDFAPDIIIWHITGHKATPIIRRLAATHTVVASVHGVMCPTGARLLRDHDEICLRSSGIGCYSRWFFRKCGTSASPYRAVQAMSDHKEMIKALMSCKRVYAVSRAIESFLTLEGISKERVRIFDNMLGQLKQLPPLEMPSHSKSVKLLYAGRLVYAKGVQYLLQAVHSLKDQHISVECAIAGDGWYKDNLVRHAENLGLAKQVRFVGKIPGREMNRLYSECDIVVIPSIWPEPGALVAPEARKMGKPVVVFDAGGLPEWAEIIDGIYVAQHADVDSLVKTIKGIMANNMPPHRKGQAAFERVDLLSDLSTLSVVIQ